MRKDRGSEARTQSTWDGLKPILASKATKERMRAKEASTSEPVTPIITEGGVKQAWKRKREGPKDRKHGQWESDQVESESATEHNTLPDRERKDRSMETPPRPVVRSGV